MNSILKASPQLSLQPERETRFSTEAEILTDIYDERCNLAVWQRQLSLEIEGYLQQVLSSEQRINLKTLFTCQPGMEQAVRESLEQILPDAAGRDVLVADILQLMDMYECLFEPRMIGVRLASLQQAMCPKFHVDYLPARLVTTYKGSGTQWIKDSATGGPRIPTENPENYEQLNTGDVALLKGDGWFDNEGLGIVHRSPPVQAGTQRLFLSLDWAD